MANIAGWWHDIGKFQQQFQRYIGADPELSNEGSSAHSVPHSAAGAALAWERFQGNNETCAAMLSLVLEAHHGALKEGRAIEDVSRQRGTPLLAEARRNGLPGEIEALPGSFHGNATALAVRMLFSALVDADLLDTEAWDRGTPRGKRGESLDVLLRRVTACCEKKIADAQLRAKTETEIRLGDMRRQVYEACVASAHGERGAFTLTVPTGGGKTLSGLAFALRHAVHHGMARVIVVAPYTSILEQTAGVYRDVLGEENIIEHHSNITPQFDTDRNRQACENWDAPIIATTSVQLLESLHAAHKRACRKLHRVANSVVLLDEVQTFPPHLLEPIHACLKRLIEDFGVTVIHGTATQPLLASSSSALPKALQSSMQEIIPNPRQLFDTVRGRIRMERLGDLQVPLPLPELADAVRQHPTALAIVHRREDAVRLAEQLGPECLHLSALMCADHRAAVLDQVRLRLCTNEPCLLVSTQLIEAGVDIDFPVVFRALAGLETLAQAAGRCNREMRMAGPGRFFIYRAESEPPAGSLRLSLQIGQTYFDEGENPDLSDPSLFPKYMKRVLRLMETDKLGILGLEKEWDFPAVAAKFRMVEESGISVVAPYGAASDHINEVRRKPTRDNFRALQRFTVGSHKTQADALHQKGCLEPVFPSVKNSAEQDVLWMVREGVPNVYHARFGFGGEYAAMVPLIQ